MSTNQSNNLRPCPFCGGKNVLSTELQDGLPFIAYCQCGAENEAENWNTRPIEDELRKRIAELESWINKFIAEGEYLSLLNGIVPGDSNFDKLVEGYFEERER